MEFRNLKFFAGLVGHEGKKYQPSDGGPESRPLRTQWKVWWEPSEPASANWKFLAEGPGGEGSCSMAQVDLQARDYGVKDQVVLEQARSLWQEGDG